MNASSIGRLSRTFPATRRGKGFSLVEITIAIGVVSFALLGVLVLLPVGLASARDAREEAFAAQALKAIASSLQGASNTAALPYTYTALAPFNNASQGAFFQWTVGNGVQAGQTIYLGYDGLPTTQKQSARQIACLQITPPTSLLSSGQAYICVAWPAAGITTPVTWSNNHPQLTTQQGFVETVVYFNPQGP